MQRENPMSLDQRIRKLGAPLRGLLKNKGLSSTRKQSYIVKTYSRVVRAFNVHWRPSETPPVPPPTLPVELWTEIFHELGPEEWVRLCRVCWLFYHIAQPCLYEEVTIRSRDIHKIYDGRNGYSQPQFQRTIHERPEFGAHVRSLTFDTDDGPGSYHMEFFPLIYQLYLFPNLERLRVRHIHFHIEFCNILHSHPRLKSVTVDGCTLDQSLAIPLIDEDYFPNSSISTVEVLYPEHSPLVHAWAVLTPAKLESLAVRTPRESDAGLILTSIRTLNKTSFLTALSLDTFSDDVILFLIASPQLRRFTLVSWMHEYDFTLYALPADAIPFLEEYDGPAELSSTFIRGRPVHTVKCLFPHHIPENRIVEILTSLQYGSIAVKSLELSLSDAPLGSWLSLIPVTVRYLTFDYLNWPDFKKWLPALSRLTNLGTLSFSDRFNWPVRKALRRDEVMKISNACPSLREIDIGRRIWRVGEQRVWEPFTVLRIEAQSTHTI